MSVEYKVRPVTRYIVTRYAQGPGGCESSQIGEYPNADAADLVADALVALDQSNGIDARRVREGMTLGEVIAGSRRK